MHTQHKDIRSLPWREAADSDKPFWTCDADGTLFLRAAKGVLAAMTYCCCEEEWSTHTARDDLYDVTFAEAREFVHANVGARDAQFVRPENGLPSRRQLERPKECLGCAAFPRVAAALKR